MFHLGHRDRLQDFGLTIFHEAVSSAGSSFKFV
jgi:hypothetical protein